VAEQWWHGPDDHTTVRTLKNSHLLSERERLISGFAFSTLFGNCAQHEHTHQARTEERPDQHHACSNALRSITNAMKARQQRW
jgi:hypothetical protein